MAASGRTARLALGVALMAMVVHLTIEIVAARQETSAGQGQFRDVSAVVLSLLAGVAVCIALRTTLRDRRLLLDVMEQLREAEQQSAGILSIAADAIITIDSDQRILRFNRGAESTFGWSAEEAIGQPLAILLPPRVHDAHRHHIERFGAAPEVARRMGDRDEIAGRRKDGTEFPAEASISRLVMGNRTLFTVVLRDVTLRRRQQEDERFVSAAGATLSASLDYESTLLSAVHLPVPHLADCCVLDLVDEDGSTRRIASVHDDPDHTRWLRALEDRGHRISDWPFPVATAVVSGEVVIRTEVGDREEERISDPIAGAAIRALGIRSLMTLPLVARGRAVGALTLLTNTPTRDLGEEQLVVARAVAKLIALAIDNAGLYRAAQRANIARDEILGVVSHDLRNPLSAIAMCAQVLQNQASEEPGDQAELLDAIIASTEMMNRLIRDLLDVSTIESGHLQIDPSPQSLEPLVASALEMLRAPASERQVELRSVIPTPFPNLAADGMRVVQVLTNLLANAVKFTDAGGTVTLTAEERDGHAVISVRDTGIGIPPSHLPHIFDRHWHANRAARTAGTGLGLAIAQGLVHAHGGRLWVDSTEGQGSTFWFSIPIAASGGPTGTTQRQETAANS